MLFKKIISSFFAIFLLWLQANPVHADSPAKPVVTSFTITPDSLDLVSGKPAVKVILQVSSQFGIANSQTLVTITDGGPYKVTAPLLRSDVPQNISLANVRFEGIVDVSSLPAGAYSVNAAPLTALNSNGTTGYATDILYPTTSSKIIGAENLLLMRSNGDLNYAYPTFTGPAYNRSIANNFKSSKFTTVADPIWRVGENFNPSDYFELNAPSLQLKIKTSTNKTCTSDGSTLTLIAVGGCAFTVYTDKTADYQYYKYDQTVSITDARIKPVYVIANVATQSASTLPLSIPGPYVMGPTGLVVPVSTTPSVCFGAGFYITITSGGTCTLNYSTPGTANYLPSDLYTLTFQITRTAQTLVFTPPTTVALLSKSLALTATASSGQLVTFLSTTPNICSVTGNSLNLLKAGTCQVTASQNGTPTIAPVSAVHSIAITGTPGVAKAVKKSVCIKNGKTKMFSSNTCPPGYKVKI
jgi:hypothetical protein